MHMLTRRTQVLLDDERYIRLERRARETDRSVGAVIREAIDRAFPARTMSRDEALEHFRMAPPLEGSDQPEDVKRDILSRYDRHDP